MMESELKDCLERLLEMSKYCTKEEVEEMLKTIKGEMSPYRIWVGTQVEYEGISTKDSNTLYFVRGNDK